MERNVLLIDDEASLRRNVSMGLMQRGIHTEPCETGMKALQTLEVFKRKSIPLDCAVVDIRLPDIDGLKLLKVIKFNYPELPVIVITGYSSETIKEEAKTADAYLEKPFTVDELVSLLGQMPAAEAKAGEAEATPVEKAEPAESFSAYALVSLSRAADLMGVYRKLYFHENVLHCDAIRGDHDLILLLQAGTAEDIRDVVDTQIKAIEGVSDVAILSVQMPVFGENVTSIIGSVDKALGRDKEEGEVYTNQTARTRVSSYVLMEIEKEKLEAVYPSLYFDDSVVHCDYTRGKYDIVLLMRGSSFADIGTTIKNKFKSMDGVLRIKEWPIITLFEV